MLKNLCPTASGAVGVLMMDQVCKLPGSLRRALHVPCGCPPLHPERIRRFNDPCLRLHTCVWSRIVAHDEPSALATTKRHSSTVSSQGSDSATSPEKEALLKTISQWSEKQGVDKHTCRLLMVVAEDLSLKSLQWATNHLTAGTADPKAAWEKACCGLAIAYNVHKRRVDKKWLEMSLEDAIKGLEQNNGNGNAFAVAKTGEINKADLVDQKKPLREKVVLFKGIGFVPLDKFVAETLDDRYTGGDIDTNAAVPPMSKMNVLNGSSGSGKTITGLLMGSVVQEKDKREGAAPSNDNASPEARKSKKNIVLYGTRQSVLGDAKDIDDTLVNEANDVLRTMTDSSTGTLLCTRPKPDSPSDCRAYNAVNAVLEAMQKAGLDKVDAKDETVVLFIDELGGAETFMRGMCNGSYNIAIEKMLGCKKVYIILAGTGVIPATTTVGSHPDRFTVINVENLNCGKGLWSTWYNAKIRDQVGTRKRGLAVAMQNPQFRTMLDSFHSNPRLVALLTGAINGRLLEGKPYPNHNTWNREPEDVAERILRAAVRDAFAGYVQLNGLKDCSPEALIGILARAVAVSRAGPNPDSTVVVKDLLAKFGVIHDLAEWLDELDAKSVPLTHVAATEGRQMLCVRTPHRYSITRALLALAVYVYGLELFYTTYDDFERSLRDVLFCFAVESLAAGNVESFSTEGSWHPQEVQRDLNEPEGMQTIRPYVVRPCSAPAHPSAGRPVDFATATAERSGMPQCATISVESMSASRSVESLPKAPAAGGTSRKGPATFASQAEGVLVRACAHGSSESDLLGVAQTARKLAKMARPPLQGGQGKPLNALVVEEMTAAIEEAQRLGRIADDTLVTFDNSIASVRTGGLTNKETAIVQAVICHLETYVKATGAAQRADELLRNAGDKITVLFESTNIVSLQNTIPPSTTKWDRDVIISKIRTIPELCGQAILAATHATLQDGCTAVERALSHFVTTIRALRSGFPEEVTGASEKIISDLESKFSAAQHAASEAQRATSEACEAATNLQRAAQQLDSVVQNDGAVRETVTTVVTNYCEWRAAAAKAIDAANEARRTIDSRAMPHVAERIASIRAIYTSPEIFNVLRADVCALVRRVNGGDTTNFKNVQLISLDMSKQAKGFESLLEILVADLPQKLYPIEGETQPFVAAVLNKERAPYADTMLVGGTVVVEHGKYTVNLRNGGLILVQAKLYGRDLSEAECFVEHYKMIDARIPLGAMVRSWVIVGVRGETISRQEDLMQGERKGTFTIKKPTPTKADKASASEPQEGTLTPHSEQSTPNCSTAQGTAQEETESSKKLQVNKSDAVKLWKQRGVLKANVVHFRLARGEPAVEELAPVPFDWYFR